MNSHCNIALLFDAAPGWPPVSILRIVHFPQNSPSYKYTQILGNCLHTNIYKYKEIAFIQNTYKYQEIAFIQIHTNIKKLPSYKYIQISGYHLHKNI